MLYQGQQFAFEASARIGAGGMGEVYVGHRVDAPDEHFALKVPLPQFAADVDVFLREAEAAARVSGPNVVRVIDWGDPPPFIAFEFIEGTTLDKVLRERGGEERFWSETELVGVYAQLVDALRAINKHVIHRDLKPDNTFVLEDGTLKVGDFGLAKYVDEVTRTSTFKGGGTAAYMAPETFRLTSIDWRADQYSLGIMFFEVATLRRPFVGNWDELERLHLYERPQRLTAVASGFSERLASVVARMLEKQPERRFPSWDALDAELNALRESYAPSPQHSPEDPLAGAAAQQLERVRAQALAAERSATERRRAEDDRQSLLTYWSTELFDKVGVRVEGLNRSLGEQAIRLGRFAGAPRIGQKRQCEITFVHAHLELTLETVPVEVAADILLWGLIELTTNGRGWYGNLLLTPSPSSPYGTWRELDMRMGPIPLAGTDPSGEDPEGGGRYRVRWGGGDRQVVALNWQAVAFQRKMRNVTSLVQYAEKPLAFDSLLDELMTILVEDANIEPPKYPGGSRLR
jgi:eukaryotic-like serine/threonine-protein kinase